MSLKDPLTLRKHLVAAASNLVGNKMLIFDALLQCREDYMASAEVAIKAHQDWRKATHGTPGMRDAMLKEQAEVIERCQSRLEMLNLAMQELAG